MVSDLHLDLESILFFFFFLAISYQVKGGRRGRWEKGCGDRNEEAPGALPCLGCEREKENTGLALTLAFGGGVPRAWPLFISALQPLPGLGWLLVILRMTLTVFKLL